jgi:hypothetical protein
MRLLTIKCMSFYIPSRETASSITMVNPHVNVGAYCTGLAKEQIIGWISATMFDFTARCLLQLLQYEGVSKSFRTGRLEREQQMVQLSITRCSCIDILWVRVSFAPLTLCVASQRVFIVVVYFVIDSVRKLLDTPSYMCKNCVQVSGHSVCVTWSEWLKSYEHVYV